MMLNFRDICRLCLTKERNEAMFPLFIEHEEEEEEESNLSLPGKVMALASVEKASCLRLLWVYYRKLM
jgi:hypothetical protein